jgi:IS605 OrfB family transposase
MCISYDPIPKELKMNLLDNRIMGIDMNPDDIGVSILEFNKDNSFKIIHHFSVMLGEINKKCKGNNDKRDYEHIMISKQITKFLKAFNVKNIALEDLTMESKNHYKGKALNVVLNTWNRKLMFNNILKRCKIEGFKAWLVDPKYTSTIGNLQYNIYDPINSSIEIGRRGYLVNKLKIEEQFYPTFELKTQWLQRKDAAETSRSKSWIEIHNLIKNSKMKYRVLMTDVVSFRRECIKNIPIGIF